MSTWHPVIISKMTYTVFYTILLFTNCLARQLVNKRLELNPVTSTLKMKAAYSFETSVSPTTLQGVKPKYYNLYIH